MEIYNLFKRKKNKHGFNCTSETYVLLKSMCPSVFPMQVIVKYKDALQLKNILFAYDFIPRDLR